MPRFKMLLNTQAVFKIFPFGFSRLLSKPFKALAFFIAMFLAQGTFMTPIQAQSTTCKPGFVMNGNGDPWSEECYLNENCLEQGNPCTANDVNLIGVFIADPGGNTLPACTPGETVTITLWGQFFNNTGTNRYAVRTRREVFLDGFFDQVLNSGSFDNLPPVTQDNALLGSFDYTCGQVISLRNTWIGW